MNNFQTTQTGKRIFVTGGAGYIGSHTVIELLKEGYEVTIFDNLENSSLEYLQRMRTLAEQTTKRTFDFIKGDLRIATDIESALETNDFFGVIHFAGYKNVYDSQSNPDKYYENNVIGSLNLLRAMLKVGVKNIVFSSSYAVYGHPERLPIDEALPINPLNPYAKTKAVVESLLQDFTALGVNSVRLRYFNAAGAHPSGRIGENPQILANIIPRIFGAALGLWKLQIYGNEYDTRDGFQIRDYIHVQDLATAHIKALQYLANNSGSSVFDLGTGTGVSNLELIQEVEKVTAKKVTYEVVAPKSGDIISIYGDSSLAAEKLAWQPVYDYHDIIENAWSWYQRSMQFN